MISSKLMGAVMIIACGIIIGLSVNFGFRKRINILEDFAGFLHESILSIEFSAKSLPDIIAESNSMFAQSISRIIESGAELGVAWQKAADEFSNTSDKSFVINVFEDFGSAGTESECEKLRKSLTHCEEIVRSVKENMQKKGKTQAVLPVYAAVIVLLILL